MAIRESELVEYFGTMEDTTEAKHFQNWHATRTKRTNRRAIHGSYSSYVNADSSKEVGLFKSLDVVAHERLEIETYYTFGNTNLLTLGQLPTQVEVTRTNAEGTPIVERVTLKVSNSGYKTYDPEGYVMLPLVSVRNSWLLVCALRL